MSLSITALLPRLHADKISGADLHRLIKMIHTDAGVRENCGMLGMFSQDIDIQLRRERFVDCVQLLLTSTRPDEAEVAEDMLVDMGNETAVPGGVSVHPELVIALNKRALVPQREWERQFHFFAMYEGTSGRKMVSLNVSPYLADRLRALEAIWLVVGYGVQ